MKIYLDIFFLVNTGMNFVVFMIESFFQNRKIYPLRLLLTSAIGGALSVVFIVSRIHRFWWLSIPAYVVGSGILVRVAFGKTTMSAWIRNLIIFYVSSFLLSGLLTHMQQALGGGQGNSLFLLGAAGIALWICYRLAPVGRRWQQKSRQYVTFRLAYQGKILQGKGLIDTGNHLRDPFSGQPVGVGEKRFLTQLIEKDPPVFRYIPYHTIGNGTGMIPAFQAEYIEVEKQGRWCRAEKPWIALNSEMVSSDGEYELILQPDMFINK